SWGNTYEQYIGREGWNAFKVHGGDPKIIGNFAKYVECDVKGQLNKYDSDGNYLFELQRRLPDRQRRRRGAVPVGAGPAGPGRDRLLVLGREGLRRRVRRDR